MPTLYTWSVVLSFARWTARAAQVVRCVAGCLHFGTFYRFHVHSCLAYISETYDCPKGHSVGTASGVVYVIFLGFSVVVIDMFKSIIVLSKCFLWYWRRQHVLSTQKVHGVVFMATLTNANGLLH